MLFPDFSLLSSGILFLVVFVLIFLFMIPHLKKIWATEHIRKKILVTLGIVAIYKLLSAIPVP